MIRTIYFTVNNNIFHYNFILCIISQNETRVESMALTDKQERFCQEYLIDLNATQAAIRAGYSEKTAYSIGGQNLKKLEIQKKISEMKEERSSRTEITTDRVLEGIANIAFWDDTKPAAINGIGAATPDESGGAHVTNVKTADRLKALEKLYNHVTGTEDNPGATVNINIKPNHALDAVIDSLTSDED